MLQFYVALHSFRAGAADRFRSIAHREDGATAAEYGLLVAGIALAIVLAVFAFGDALSGFFDDLTARVSGWGGGGGTP